MLTNSSILGVCVCYPCTIVDLYLLNIILRIYFTLQKKLIRAASKETMDWEFNQVWIIGLDRAETNKMDIGRVVC